MSNRGIHFGRLLKKMVGGLRLVPSAGFWRYIIGVRRFCVNWPYLILAGAGIVKNPHPVCLLRSGLRFKISSMRTWGTIISICGEKIWTPEGHEVESGDTVVDIGAHIGTFSVLAATSASNVRVFSYEPDPTNFDFLTQNIRLNNLRNVKAFPLAVAGNRGSTKLFTAPADDAHSTVGLAGVSVSSRYVDVRCITLEDVIHEVGRCDFLKINCEGAEYEILMKTPEKSLRAIRKMSIDCHPIPDHNCSDLGHYLEGIGFSIKGVGDGAIECSSHIHLYAQRREGQQAPPIVDALLGDT